MRAIPACLTLIVTLSAAACGGDESESGGVGNGGSQTGGSGSQTGGSGSQTGGSGGTPPIIVQGGTGAGGTGAGATVGSGGGMIVTTLPPDFTPSNAGGYKIGEPVDPNMTTPPVGGGCNNLLTGIVRDFRGLPDGHPNFQMDIDEFGVYPGMVNDALGSNKKPVFSGMVTQEVATNAADFDQWYLNTDDVNRPYYLTVFLEPGQDGLFTFHSDSFFPVDGTGWNDENDGEGGEQHNFFFTFELHTTFQYRGGETFTFIGDDDVWVFINGQLAVDIGGVHGQSTDEVNLDAEASRLGIQVGMTYPLDMFHAERHTSESNFRIDTSLAFNCSVFVPDVPR